MALDNGWKGFGHAEWGYNSGANGNNIYDRLLYAGMTFHVGENWEAVSEGTTDVMFDTLGGEFYTYYHMESGLRPTLAYNYLIDRNDETHGFERQLLIPGVEYHFQKNKFLVWTEYQFDLGDDAYNGTQFENRDDQFAAGIRYYF